MIFIDTHSHLYLEDFNDDLSEVVHRAIDKGVKYIVLPNIDSQSINDLKQLAANYPVNLFPAMGLHPTSVKENYLLELDTIQQELKSSNFCAIGEIGIDLYWDKTWIKQQEDAFVKQIIWASEMKLPVIIHSRESIEIILKILDDYKSLHLTGVLHCFPGETKHAEQAIENGFLIGIGGVVTYKNSKMAEVVKHIPLETIVLETDSPYLTPHPYRGKRNESMYILNIAEKIAEIKQISIKQVAETTSRNAAVLFNINIED